MKKRTFKRDLFIVLMSVFFFISCMENVDWDKQFDDLKLDQAFVLPLGEAEVTVDDILRKADSIPGLETNTGNDIFFSITDSVDWDFQPIVPLGLVDYVKDTVELGSLTPSNGYIDGAFNTYLELGINTNIAEERIDTSVLNAAIMNFKVSVANLSVNPSDVELTFEFPEDRLKFESSTVTNLTYTPHLFNDFEDKSISSFKYFAPNAATNIPVTVRYKIKVGNNPLTAQSKLFVESKFKSMSHRVSYGFYTPDATFVNAILGFVQMVDISEFVNKIEKYGVFKIAEPEIRFDVKNYMGVNVKIDFKKMCAYRLNDPTFDTIFALFNGLKSKSEIIAPIPSYENYAPVLTTFVMNQKPENGEIHKFFATDRLPDHYKFDVDVDNARTPAETHQIPDFVTNRHRLQVKTTIRMPLKLDIGSWVSIKDTIKDVKLDSTLKDDVIQRAQLVFKITNKLPVGCKVTAKFLDENGVTLPLDLLTSSDIKAPEVDNNGNVVANQLFEPSMMYMTVQKSQLDLVKKTKKIALDIVLNGADQKQMNFQKDNSIKVKLGVFVQGDYNVKLKK